MIQAVVKPGRYTLVTTTSKPEIVGSYDVKHSMASSARNGCEGVYVTKGTSVETSLVPGTCESPAQRSSAIYRIYMTGGSSMEVKLHDRSYSGPDFEISTQVGAVLQKGAHVAPYDATAVFVAPATGVYVIRVWSDYDDGFEYTIEFR